MKLVCNNCGGSNIEVKAWVNPNTLEIIQMLDDEIEDIWCRDCNLYVGITEIHDDELQLEIDF